MPKNMHCSHLPRRCSSFTLVHVLSDVLYPRWINISTQPHPRISRLYPCLVHLKAVTPSLAHCVPLNRGEWRRPRHRSCWMPAAAERDSCAGINFAGRIQRGKPGEAQRWRKSAWSPEQRDHLKFSTNKTIAQIPLYQTIGAL